MPFCPTCRQEYVDGAITCTDCGVGLVTVLPPQLPAVGPISDPAEAEDDLLESADLKEVWRSQGEYESQVIRALLDSVGIRSVFRGEALRNTLGFTMDGLAVVRILVRPEDADRARAIISADSVMECPACGAQVRSRDVACPACGRPAAE